MILNMVPARKFAINFPSRVLSARISFIAIRYLSLGITLVAMAVVPLYAKQVIGQYKGYKRWNEAYFNYQYNIYEDAVSTYEKARAYLPTNGLLLQMHGKCLAMSERWDESINMLEKAKIYRSDQILYTSLGDSYMALKQYGKAEEAYRQAMFIIPHKFYPKYLLAKCYYGAGKYIAAADIAKQLLASGIKVESEAIGEMKNEMKQLLDDLQRNSVK